MNYYKDDYGNQFYYLNNDLHREDGPAVEYYNGDKEWWLNGKRHRLNGPAIKYSDRKISWWIGDKRVKCRTQEEFEQLIKLKAFW